MISNFTRKLVSRPLQPCRWLADASAARQQWDLCVGVLVERMPVVSRALNATEQQFQDLMSRVEFENSLKSDFELKHERELRQAELLKKGEVELDLDENAGKQTAQDLKDAYIEEAKQFVAASRTTADDAANRTESTNRCLDDTLYLLVEQQLGAQRHLLLPQGQRQDGETMRSAAERVLRERCGDQLRVQFYGNAPCGFYKYKYPQSMAEQGPTAAVGAKVFFYRAAWQAGNVRLPNAAVAVEVPATTSSKAGEGKKTKAATGKTSQNKKVAESADKTHEWLTKEVLAAKLNGSSAAYARSVDKFLL